MAPPRYYQETTRRPGNLHWCAANTQHQQTGPTPQQLEAICRQPSCSLERISTHSARDLSSEKDRVQLLSTSLVPEPLQCVEVRPIYQASSTQAPAPVQAYSLLKRLCSTSLEPVCTARRQCAQFPVMPPTWLTTHLSPKLSLQVLGQLGGSLILNTFYYCYFSRTDRVFRHKSQPKELWLQ